MAHNDHIIPYGLWTSKTVPTPSMLERMDLLSSQSLNGGGGGTWAPATPIIVGGKGTIIRAGSLTGGISSGSNSLERPIRLSNSVWPRFTTPRSRTRLYPITDTISKKDVLPLALTPIASTPAGYISHEFEKPIISPIPSFRLDHGATVSSVTVTFTVTQRPSGTDLLSGPIFRLMAFNRDKTTMRAVAHVPAWQSTHTYVLNDVVVATPQTDRAFVCTLGGTSAGSQPASFATAVYEDLITDGSVHWKTISCGSDMVESNYSYLYSGSLTIQPYTLEYYNNGLPQTLTMVPNVNPVLDTNNLSYYLWILNVLKGDMFHSLSITTTGTSNMRPAV